MRRGFLGVTLLVVIAAGACSAPAADGGDPTATGASEGEDAGLSAADAEILRWVEDERIPGAVLLVSRGGDLIFEKAYGYAQLFEYDRGFYGAAAAGEARPDAIRRLDAPIPMRVDTVFDLASLTKMMATTFAVMLLVDEGKLDLDAAVQQYMPDFGAGADASTSASGQGGSAEPVGGRADAESAQPVGAGESADAGEPPRGGEPASRAKTRITLRQLLTHRSGLSQWQPIYYAADDSAGAYGFIRDLPLAWPPSVERHYSDLGFMLLGLVVERVTGESLGSFVRRRLYQPLGLSATGFRPTAARAADGGTSGDSPSAGRDATLTAGDSSSTGSPTDTNRPGASNDPSPVQSEAAHPYAATSHGNPFEHRMVHDPDFGYRIEGDPDAWDGWRHDTLVGEVNDGNAFHAFGGEAGHAGLFSTAAELRILLQLLLDGGEYGDRRYLSTEVVDEFLTDVGDGQALGWLVPDYLPAGSFYHTGFTGTYVAGIPAQGVAIVLLTNRQNVGVDADGRYTDIGALQRAVATAITGGR